MCVHDLTKNYHVRERESLRREFRMKRTSCKPYYPQQQVSKPTFSLHNKRISIFPALIFYWIIPDKLLHGRFYPQIFRSRKPSIIGFIVIICPRPQMVRMFLHLCFSLLFIDAAEGCGNPLPTFHLPLPPIPDKNSTKFNFSRPCR